MNKQKATWLIAILLALAVALGALLFAMGSDGKKDTGSADLNDGTGWFSISRSTESSRSGSAATAAGEILNERTETRITTETSTSTNTNTGTPPIVGGDRDEHGCIGSAGYQWNASVGACIRPWELNEAQRNAARTAMQHLGGQYGAAITEVKQGICPECFTVTVQTPTARSVVTIERTAVR